ncbi:PadR family transcriptional regulator [Micromonospora sp. SL4-19]|uniref:PadR family transcriptional regulator n=1 Tax=Micromonospora sp. SL4-19 TaxID=3399129 RepID=UPI003A4D6582
MAMDLRGHLDLLILAALRRTGPTHGYALIQALRERSDGTFDLPEGTVYPALHRLERAGLVVSAWHDGGGRRRRCYELTDQGLAALVTKQSEWQALVRGVAAVLAPTQGAAT